MKTAILYASSHGRTRKVVSEAVAQLSVRPDVFDVKDVTDPEFLKSYDVLLLFCPTYGDEELQPDMESFLQRFDLDLSGRRFAVCELGNYYGYDDFSFGAGRIIRETLLGRGAEEFCEPLSLDSMPRLNREHLLSWIRLLDEKLNGLVLGH